MWVEQILSLCQYCTKVLRTIKLLRFSNKEGIIINVQKQQFSFPKEGQGSDSQELVKKEAILQQNKITNVFVASKRAFVYQTSHQK